jgi:hypothetical protein
MKEQLRDEKQTYTDQQRNKKGQTLKK